MLRQGAPTLGKPRVALHPHPFSHLPQRIHEIGVPTLVLLNYVFRNPLQKHRIYEHLHEGVGPAVGKSSLVPPLREDIARVRALGGWLPHHLCKLAPIEGRNQVLHAKAAIELGWARARQRGRSLQEGAPEEPWLLYGRLAPERLAGARAHATPVGHDARARKHLVTVVQDTGRRGGQCRSDHDAHILSGLVNFAPVHSILPKELVQRHVAHESLPIGAKRILCRARELPANDAKAVVELVDLALPRDFGVRAGLPEERGRLQRPGARGVQRHHRHQAQHQWEAQAQEDRLEDRIITAAQSPGVHLLKALAQEVHGLSITRELAHLVHRISEHIAQPLGSFRRLRGVLEDILHHSPEIQTWPPVDVPHVGQEHVGLVTANQPIVARKSRVPLPLPLAHLQRHALRPRTLLVGKPIPAIGALGFASGARMLAEDGSRLGVPVVAAAALHERGHQAPKLREVYARVRRAGIQDLGQDLAEAAAGGLRFAQARPFAHPH